MSDGNRGDRGALIALGMALAAIVVVSLFAGSGDPSNQAAKDVSEQYSGAKDAQSQAVQTVHWGLFTVRDTLAQWVAALASIGSVAVSVWAVKLVHETLKETRSSVKAAAEANKIARNLGEVQIRPYLSCIDGSANFAKELSRIVFSIKNNGQTPANNILVSACITIATLGDGFEDASQQQFKVGDLEIGHIVAGGVEKSVVYIDGSTVLGVDIVQKLLDWGVPRRLYVDLDISWDDVFPSALPQRILVTLFAKVKGEKQGIEPYTARDFELYPIRHKKILNERPITTPDAPPPSLGALAT